MPPWLLLALLLSLAIALLYQLLTRRFGLRLLPYWLVVFAGFLGAEIFAESAGLDITRVGELRLLPDLAGAMVVTALLWFLGW